ncbi:MAG: hypothetical protein MJ105_07565 [Lachnospiraceae bacterium]|nr:hypothetical protein [Lachnospiraceae bacterium]
MAKKFGKVLVFTAIAGATAAGVYHYLQTKKAKEAMDDLDDFDLFDEDEAPAAKRKYVSLDGVKNFASTAAGKVKDAATKVKDKFTKKDAEDAADEVAETAAEEVKEAVSEEEFFDDEV